MIALPKRGRWPALAMLAVAWLAGATLALASHHLLVILVLLGALWTTHAAGALWRSGPAAMRTHNVTSAPPACEGK